MGVIAENILYSTIRSAPALGTPEVTRETRHVLEEGLKMRGGQDVCYAVLQRVNEESPTDWDLLFVLVGFGQKIRCVRSPTLGEYAGYRFIGLFNPETGLIDQVKELPERIYVVADTEWGRRWYGDIVGCAFKEPPGYAPVEVLESQGREVAHLND